MKYEFSKRDHNNRATLTINGKASGGVEDVEEGEGESEVSEGGRILCGSSPFFSEIATITSVRGVFERGFQVELNILLIEIIHGRYSIIN